METKKTLLVDLCIEVNENDLNTIKQFIEVQTKLFNGIVTRIETNENKLIYG